VTQIGLRDAFGYAWLPKRVRPQLGIGTELLTAGYVGTTRAAIRRSFKAIALERATQLHVAEAIFGKLNPSPYLLLTS
jgi:hypothetical protein